MELQIGGWTEDIVCLTWLATALIFVAFIWQLVDTMVQKEKRLRGGEVADDWPDPRKSTDV
jgi:hypothetical protein